MSMYTYIHIMYLSTSPCLFLQILFGQHFNLTIKQFRINHLPLLIKRIHQTLQIQFVGFQKEDPNRLIIFDVVKDEEAVT